MSDLFRGYDLTTVAEAVARKHHERNQENVEITPEMQKNIDADPMSVYRPWDDLHPFIKQQIKSVLLPIVSDVLDALETAKPMPAKEMREYGEYDSRTQGHDPRFYENVDTMHAKDTATVWVLHVKLQPRHLDPVLARMAATDETTGEYTYGDSFTEWGTATANDDDKHLAVYYEATPNRAGDVGMFLLNCVVMASMQADRSTEAEVPLFAISTAADYAEQLDLTP